MLIDCFKRHVYGSFHGFFLALNIFYLPNFSGCPEDHCRLPLFSVPGRHHFMGLHKKRNVGSVVSSQRQNWKPCILSKWLVPCVTGRSGWWKVRVIKVVVLLLLLCEVWRVLLHSWVLRIFYWCWVLPVLLSLTVRLCAEMIIYRSDTHSWQSIQS